MTTEQHIQGILGAFKAQDQTDFAYDFFSGLHDVLVLRHSAADNPYEPAEEPYYSLYRSGAEAGQAVLNGLYGPPPPNSTPGSN